MHIKNTPYSIGIILIIAVAALLRFLPHPPNMTPVIAITVLSVAHFNQKKAQFGIPLAIMLITDAIIGFHALIPVVYISLAIAGVTGLILKKRRTLSGIVGSSLLASILFFTLSNVGVWAFTDMYAKTGAGVIACYIAAIPFFHNSVIATVSVLMAVFALDKVTQKNVLDFRLRGNDVKNHLTKNATFSQDY